MILNQVCLLFILAKYSLIYEILNEKRVNGRKISETIRREKMNGKKGNLTSQSKA